MWWRDAAPPVDGGRPVDERAVWSVAVVSRATVTSSLEAATCDLCTVTGGRSTLLGGVGDLGVAAPGDVGGHEPFPAGPVDGPHCGRRVGVGRAAAEVSGPGLEQGGDVMQRPEPVARVTGPGATTG